jgi:NAD(P)-dependent dehydrogenase (short-subunit alcohol dehydrogenase family)
MMNATTRRGAVAVDRQESIRGQVVLVTGANRGIGLAIAEALGELGMLVLVGARSADSAEVAVAHLRAGGIDALPLVIDICDDASVAAARREIERRPGRLDVLVNNAAIKLEHHPSPPSAAPLDAILATLDTNVVGTIRVVQTMLPLLLRSERPRIVNMSSGLGSLTYATTEGSKYRARPLASYSTSKAALNMVTVLFANELADTLVRVNAVDPGPVNTPMTQGRAIREPQDGARPVVDCVLLANDGPTGSFFDENGVVPW